MPVPERESAIADVIRRDGPITFARFQELALYDPAHGFFSAGGAGRAGRDFVTSPETGQLFGMLVARHLDAVWHELGEPDPYVVVEAGAGRGKLAADVLRATPACAPALRYLLVERSAVLRTQQRQLLTLEPADEALGPFAHGVDPDDPSEPVTGSGPIAAALPELPTVDFTGVVLANELLDNLPVRIVERVADGWEEVRVALDDRGRPTEALVPAAAELAAEADLVAAEAAVPIGARLPVPEALVAWVDDVARVLRRGELLVLDYVAPAAELVARGSRWLRTYHAHQRGVHALESPGMQDITADVPREHLVHVARRAGLHVARDVAQADFLADLGMEELVEEGRAVWRARAHLGDLEAIAGRSRVAEAAALSDPAGLGAHRVVAFRRAVD